MNQSKFLRAIMVAILLFTGLESIAQNWQTVYSKDTQFFYASGNKDRMSVPNHDQYNHPIPLNAVLRAVYVAQAIASGTDSIFHFNTTWRDTTGGQGLLRSNCLDSTAPSWMGRQCVHRANGEEWYSNKRNDTIKVNTAAEVGDSWTLFDNKKGLSFIATITRADTVTIGVFIDSFKTATIQAYNGNVPLNSYANKLVLQWTKNHGWLKAFDFYGFPMLDPYWGYGGEFIDATQHTRLPVNWPVNNLKADIFSRYRSSNEWLREYYYAPQAGAMIYNVDYDSIISTTVVNPNKISVLSLQRHYSITHGWPSAYSSSTVSYIINDSGSTQLEDYYFYDPIYGRVLKSPLTQRLYIDSQDFCGNYFVSRTDISPCSGVPTNHDSCYRFGCLDGVYFHRTAFLSGFGQTHAYFCYDDLGGGTYIYDEWFYSYFNINGCKHGIKLDVAKLSVPEFLLNDFKAYPNPANSILNIELPFARGTVEASLFNAIGQCVFKQQFDGKTATMNVASMPAGLYWLELVNQRGRAVQKILVTH
jgi:hypothetical protein